MDEHPPLDYNSVTDQMYIGTNACCTGHFNEQLLALGITHDLSLEETRVDTPFGATSYLWLPVKNHSAPQLRQFSLGVAYLSNIIDAGESIYVHCKNGHGRAPTMVAAFLVFHDHVTVDDAITTVYTKRHGAHIEDVQHTALDQYARSLKR